MAYKFVISKPTFDALTETDPNKLIFSSDYNTLKYYLSGSFQFNINESANSVYRYENYVNHDLGYFPFYIGYAKHQTNWIPVSDQYVTLWYGYGNGVYRYFYVWVTTTRLYVAVGGHADGVPDSYTADFKYKIYKNNLGL